MPKTPANRNQKCQQGHPKVKRLKKSREAAKQSVVSGAQSSEPIGPTEVEKRELELKLNAMLQIQILHLTNEQVRFPFM